jgi:hypothetical protein
MTEPDLDDVMDETEHPHPDRHEHAKTPRHLDEDELERRTQHERDEIEHDREQ